MIEQSKCVCRDYELPVRLSLGRYARGRDSKVEGGPKQNELTRVFELRFFPFLNITEIGFSPNH